MLKLKLVFYLFIIMSNYLSAQTTLQDARNCWKGVKAYFYMNGTTPVDQKSLQCMDEAFDFYVSDPENYPLEFGEMLYYRAYQSMQQRLSADCERFTNTGIELLKEVETPEGTRDSLLGDLYSLQAMLYSTVLFEFDRAVTTAEIAYRYYDESENVQGKTLQKLNLATTYSQFGFCEKAQNSMNDVKEEMTELLEFYQFAIRSVLKTIEGRLQLCDAYKLIGEGRFDELGSQTESARIAFKNAIPALQLIGHSPSIIANYANIGITFLTKFPPTEADFDSAAFYFGKSLAVPNNDGIDMRKTEFLRSFAKSLKKNSREDTAHLDSLLQIFGLTAASQEELSRFESMPQTGIETVQSLEILFIKTAAQYVQFQKTKDPIYLQKSLQDYEILFRLANSLRILNADDRSTEIFGSTFFFPFSQAVVTAAKLFVLTDMEDYLEKAFEFSQKSKSFVLRQAIYRNYESGKTKETKLRAKIRNLEFDYRRAKDSLQRSSILAQIHDAKQLMWNYFKEMRNSSEDIYFQNRFSNDIPNLKVIQNSLNDSTAILDFKTAIEDSSMAMIITKEKVKLAYYPKLVSIKDSITKFKDELESGSDDFGVISNQLYKILFEPIAKKLSKKIKRLIIVPDYITWDISFDALAYELDHDGNGKYLVEKFIINYQSILNTPSLSSGENVSLEKASLSGLIASYSGGLSEQNELQQDCYLNSPLQNLSLIDDVIKDVVSTSDQNDLYHPVFKQDFINNADNHPILVIAAHGCERSPDSRLRDPLDHGIIFSTEDNDTESYILRLGEIYNLAFKKLDFIFLASCNTAWGELYMGEGMLSIARGFFYAGVSTLVAGKAKIPIKGTAELIEHFFGYIYEGKDIATSLQKAKLDYLRLHSDYSGHPSNWANVVCIGNGRKRFKFQ